MMWNDVYLKKAKKRVKVSIYEGMQINNYNNEIVRSLLPTADYVISVFELYSPCWVSKHKFRVIIYENAAIYNFFLFVVSSNDKDTRLNIIVRLAG